MALNEHGGLPTTSSDHRGSPDLFEFLPISHPWDDDTMCAADDIFRRGHLLPSNAPLLHHPHRSSSNHPKPLLAAHRRAESLSATAESGGGGMAVDCRRLRRAKSEPAPRRTPAPPARPKWYVLAFGSVRVPAAMEMKDIRIRQRRQRGPQEAVRGPWRLIRSLSCKGLAGDGTAESPVVVAAPLRSF